jgi:hypothetical protein
MTGEGCKQFGCVLARTSQHKATINLTEAEANGFTRLPMMAKFVDLLNRCYAKQAVIAFTFIHSHA